MTAELDIQECVYCGQVLDQMPSLELPPISPDGEKYPAVASYYCGNCSSAFSIYFEPDENGNLIKF